MHVRRKQRDRVLHPLPINDVDFIMRLTQNPDEPIFMTKIERQYMFALPVFK